MMPSDALVIKQVLDSMVCAVPCQCDQASACTAFSSSQLCTCFASGQTLFWVQGVKEYEPKVVHQLLDFMYRNVTEVLQVAEASPQAFLCMPACKETFTSSFTKHEDG